MDEILNHIKSTIKEGWEVADCDCEDTIIQGPHYKDILISRIFILEFKKDDCCFELRFKSMTPKMDFIKWIGSYLKNKQ